MSGRVLRLAALLPVLMSLAVPAFARGQTSCSYHISLTSPLFLRSTPLPFTVNLITADQCPWTAQSFASFLTDVCPSTSLDLGHRLNGLEASDAVAPGTALKCVVP